VKRKNMLTRRGVLAGSVAAALTSSAATASRQARPGGRDQIVFIIIDDLFSLVYNKTRFGARIIAPHFFKLMTQSVTFSNAFCSTALCNPSRAAIVSGRNPIKTGVHNNTTPWFDKFDIHSTFPGLLHAAGYRCFGYGKITHGGPMAGPGNIWKTSGICEEYVQPTPLPGETVDRATSRAAITRIHGDLKTDQLGKWLLMIGLKGPHAGPGERPELLDRYPLDQIIPIDWDGDPKSVCYSGNGGFARRDEQALKEHIQGYFADITAMDQELGRVLAAIKSAGLNPTILLAADHGYSLGDHDEIGKFTLWDDAGRSPLIFQYPGCPAGMVVPQTVSLLDIAPTLLQHAGVPRPSYLDGLSLMPVIKQPTTRTSGALTTMNDSVSFRDNRYRISRYAGCDASRGLATYELYDQQLDPESRTNLFDEAGFGALRDEMLAKLNAKVAAWGG